MKDETAQIEQRVKRYWYNDGIGELMGGGIFLLLALYFSAQQYLGDRSFAGGLLQAGFVVVLIGSAFLARRLIGWLKEQVTYPRTGYVEYRSGGRNIRLMRVLSAGIAMLVAMAAIFITRRFNTIDAMTALTGLLVAVILIVKQGWASGIGRFYFLSMVSVALGVGLSISGLAQGYNLGLYYGLMGIAFAVSGGLTLMKYLRENPLIPGDENER